MNSEDSYQTINYRISEWAGIDGTEYFGRYGRSFDKDGYPPDFYHSNAAMDLLGVLVERGYTYALQDNIHGAGHGLFIWRRDDTLNELADSSYQPTVPAAICHAIIQLIEREGR